MTMESTAGQRHRVVVVGGGFGGLNAVRELADADVDVTLVDRTNHHLFQPLLYQVAAGILSARPHRAGAARHPQDQPNVRVLLADVHELDLDAKVVHAKGPDDRPVDLPYDTLIVAAGATHSYFGKNEFAEFAPGMKTIEDARLPATASSRSSRWPRRPTDPAERAEWLTFVVIGAGPTGVELVGQIAELAHTVLPRDYRSINTRDARIVLLEGRPRCCRPSTQKLQRTPAACWRASGSRSGTNTLALTWTTSRSPSRAPTGSRRSGPAPASGPRACGVPAGQAAGRQGRCGDDRAGRIPVNPDCTLPGHPEVFALGDMVSLNKLPGRRAAGHAGGPLRRRR